MTDPVLLKNLACWLGGYDFSGHLNGVNLAFAKAELPHNVFGDSAEGFWQGLQQITAEGSGFFNSADAQAPDPVLWGRIDPSLSPSPWPLVYGLPDAPNATPNTVGNTAYLVVGQQFNYSFGGAHGVLLPFSFSTKPSSTYAAYRQLIARAKGDATVTTTGAATQLGALSAAQQLVATFHVFGITGTGQWTLTIQSDDNAGFTTPTTRLTFTSVDQAADPATEVLAVSGAITDDYWRYVLTEDSGTSTITAAITWGINLL